MKTWLLLPVLLLMAFSGCERGRAIEPVDVKQVLGNWRLVQPVSTYETTLAVEVDQYSGGTASGVHSLKFTGRAAVNTYFTSARLINWATGTVDVSSVGSTKVAGSAEAMQFEQTYYANLKAVNRYELTDEKRLKLFYEGGVLVYEK
ncbi:META domain-containing protein [Spirosoma sp.]|uniref:META domain-containing protein n=1 Tax=Spirosoma sp. TaxID=1899569 RepID=UPI003B3AEF3A